MEETAYAKINLALHVRARQPDGYHRIETLFAFCEDGDRLTVGPSDKVELSVGGPFAGSLPDAQENLVVRAADGLRSRYGITKGAALILDKRLPVASGIGGGSADAAASLRLLARWWDVPASLWDLAAIGRKLGADVPACVLSTTARGDGRGDEVTSVEGVVPAKMPVLLVNPGVPLATAAVFAGWDGVDRGALPPTFESARNDLEAAAIALVPAIGTIQSRLSAQPGVTLSRMSGSGATCFALFETVSQRDAAHAAIAAENPHWWLLSTRLR
jgi:4-diphosphocytidyl-2-C-methyl-D-erythritol kinase